MSWPLTEIEKRAVEAQSLPSFPINVEEIRRTVEALLSLFGRNGIFEEYTVHSFDHVYDMLKSLEWLVPSDSRRLLTKADWLLITLSCYFHDLGLLVTRDEFDARDQSSFRDFVQNNLFAGEDGPDYQAKVHELNPEDREKFLYQEFVRYHHAARVRNWIIGKPNVALGQAQGAADQINQLLCPLDRIVRQDLANICESHNLDDLNSEEKYPLYRPYGNSEEESTNVQYLALLLRTTDLIQITKQRAPTALYKAINPKDPISQIEWLKQNGVKHVRPQPKTDRSGEINPNIQSDTIDVYADFSSPDGYFGLTSYLQYAGKELQNSYELAEKSKKSAERKLSFPWRFIDDGHIKAEGFIPQKFGFELDQKRILDLLTGHTLYNDSAVVLRELAQNSIDAVRLQAIEEKRDSGEIGQICIQLNSKNSELVITDNGTGMTQDVIERHLLRVGSSRYQDDKFKEQYPDFSPISRFGIGVLTAFMVADTVEIITCSIEDKQAREISLRSVHGRYLIRLLDKHSAPEVKSILPHGTTFRLKLRASAAKIDVLNEVKRWIIFPRCNVTVAIDNTEPFVVGFYSPKQALENLIAEQAVGLSVKRNWRVVERQQPGLTVAYALRFDPMFRDWSFISLPEPRTLSESERTQSKIPGICIEGIAVQFSPPGFRQGGIIAIANATGTTAPKTDVTRSSLENTSESQEITRKVYDILTQQIQEETTRLFEQEGYSIGRATNEVEYLAGPFMSGNAIVADSSLLSQSLARMPVFLLEDRNSRKVVSLNDLRDKGDFWTTHSPLTSSIEYLVREMPGNITARSVFELSKGKGSYLPPGDFVANANRGSLAGKMILENFEVQNIQGSPPDRTLELHWTLKEKEPRWHSLHQVARRMRQINSRASVSIDTYFTARGRESGSEPFFRDDIQIPRTTFSLSAFEGFTAVVANGTIYFQSSQTTNYINDILTESSFERLSQANIYLGSMRLLLTVRKLDETEVHTRLDQIFRDLAARGLDVYVPDWAKFAELARALLFHLYDPFAWSRREEADDGGFF